MEAAVSVVIELLLDVVVVLLWVLLYQFYQLRKLTEKSIDDLAKLVLDAFTNTDLLKLRVEELEERIKTLESIQQKEPEE